MERILLKLARQLNRCDESSVMELWNVYAGKVARFKPMPGWEEDVLVFCMIQSLHWKNQLFNAEMSLSARRGSGLEEEKKLQEELASFSMKDPVFEGKLGRRGSSGEGGPAGARAASGRGRRRSCRIIPFQANEQGE
ncbi:MAG: hypothetical protein LBQ63_07435 [Deltaproteobacteria bacterium]|jgi:hypothetical protein|nr:hypothetical protein [Deltaproteobacteria bacterium]